MLDFLKVRQQIAGLIDRRNELTSSSEEAFREAAELLEKYNHEFEQLNQIVSDAGLPILTAGFSAALKTAMDPDPRPEVCTVAAVDGSQIYPDRHEVAPCYLINIGKIRFRYGTTQRPVMDSTPRVFDFDEPFLESGSTVSATYDLVNARRTLMEMETLCELAISSQASQDPVLALTDGTLILWHLEALAEPVKQVILKRFLKNLDEFEEAGYPTAGYISCPGSSDVGNALRIAHLVESGRDPKDLRSAGGGSTPIQTVLPGITDRALFERLLKTGQRSGLFRSRSRILAGYGSHAVCFFYFNTGREIARVEVPAWVAGDPQKMSLVHSIVVDQVEKGKGYPVSLAEAHERAVVRSADRSLFFDLLSKAFVSEGIRVKQSAKVVKKKFLGI